MMACPSEEQLRRWLEGEGPASAAAAVQSHVDGCPRCQETLGRLAANTSAPRWVSLLRDGPPPELDDPSLDFLRHFLASPPRFSGPEPEVVAVRKGIHFPDPPTEQGPLGRLGPYHIVRELGRGATGFVYEALDERLGRRVAVKLLKPELAASEGGRQRFLREGRSLVAVRHEHVVTLFQVGDTPGFALPYLVMEYIEGESLQTRLEREGLVPPREAARIVREVASGLACLHARGLIHRDITSSNILLEQATGKAKLSDFGLARVAAADGDTTNRLTHVGNILGTPAYMSPEQITAPGEEKGPSDVYGLGVVLFESLTGELPFRGQIQAIFRQVVSDEPPSPAAFHEQVPRDLNTICLKCLAKEPGRRYPDAGELAQDLERFLAGEPIRARPVGRMERTIKWLRRRPAVAGLAAALLLVAALGIGGVVWQWRQTVSALADAQKAERATEINLYFSQIALADREWFADDAVQAEQALDRCPPGMRGWEWHYLKRRSQASSLVWKEHPSRRDDTVTMDASGRWLAGTWNGQLAVWGPTAGRRLLPLPAETISADVALSPGGRYAALGFADHSVLVWDLHTGAEARRLRGHTSPIHCLAFSPDGARLASGSDDKTVCLWDLGTSRLIRSFTDSTKEIRTLAFSHDGRRLAAGTGDHSAGPFPIHCWDVATGRMLPSFPGSSHWISSLAFSPTDALLAAGSYVLDNRVPDRARLTIWDVQTGTERRRIASQDTIVPATTFSPDGRQLAWLDGIRTVRVWDVAGEREVRRFPLAVPASELVFQDCRKLILLGNDYSARSLDPTEDAGCRVYRGHSSEVFTVAFSPDGRFVVSGSDDRTVKLWDVDTGQVAATLRHPGPQRWVRTLAVSRDGAHLASACWDGTVHLWDLATRQEIRTLEGHRGPVHAVAFSADGRYVASGGRDKAVIVWEVSTGRKCWRLTGHEQEVNGVAFHPAGGLLGSTAADQTVRIWDLHSGDELWHGTADAAMSEIAFSPEGDRLATGLQSGGAVLWDTVTGNQLQTFQRRHVVKITGLAFSPDGRRLATSSDDWTVKLWESDTGREILTLKGHIGGVNGVAFSPDGLRLASAGWDHTVRVWDGRP